MKTSVVIPTRDRPDVLADCLRTLNEQRAGDNEWEVIVVDDGSESPLAPLANRWAADGLPVRCERQDPAGLNAARNRGVACSSGEVVAFLDDDTLVSPSWLAALARAFDEDDCDAVGGRVTLKLEGKRPRWLTDKRLSYLSEFDLGDREQAVAGPPLPVGANFAIRRATLRQLGGFRDGLDRIGAELISNGEHELLLRLLRHGGRIVYSPEAAVAHRVPAQRLTKEWFRRRAAAQGVSDIRIEPDAEDSPRRLVREIARVARALPILLRRLAEGRGPFDAELWLISCSARIRELRRRRRHAAP